MNRKPTDFTNIIYAFQGGGALGSYQVGVYQALETNGYSPTWLIGTSIGAINAAIIAGNAPADRVPQLKKFWRTVSRVVVPGFVPTDESSRIWYNFMSAQLSLLFGAQGFFHLRLDSPYLAYDQPASTISFYDLEPIRKTLLELVDFDRLNNGEIRLSLTAVEIKQGIPVHFDNRNHKIGPEHIMASCALPPGFPAIQIGDEYYWDGGVLSGTPMALILSECIKGETLFIMTNLFDSFGLLPRSLDDVLKRRKDIIYSIRYRELLQPYIEMQRLRRIIHRLCRKIPKTKKNDPELEELRSFGNEAVLHVVRFLYSGQPKELSSKDYDFSDISMSERYKCGYDDGVAAVKQAPWYDLTTAHYGVAIHEISANATILGTDRGLRRHVAKKQ